MAIRSRTEAMQEARRQHDCSKGKRNVGLKRGTRAFHPFARRLKPPVLWSPIVRVIASITMPVLKGG